MRSTPFFPFLRAARHDLESQERHDLITDCAGITPLPPIPSRDILRNLVIANEKYGVHDTSKDSAKAVSKVLFIINFL